MIIAVKVLHPLLSLSLSGIEFSYASYSPLYISVVGPLLCSMVKMYPFLGRNWCLNCRKVAEPSETLVTLY
jgi:hypothetical protein